MLDIIAFQHRILMYYFFQYCYRCRSGGILDERFADVECPGVQNRPERVIRYFMYFSLPGKGHRGLSRAPIPTSNIARLYGKLETSKGAKIDFGKGPSFPCGGYGGEAVQLFSDVSAN